MSSQTTDIGPRGETIFREVEVYEIWELKSVGEGRILGTTTYVVIEGCVQSPKAMKQK